MQRQEKRDRVVSLQVRDITARSARLTWDPPPEVRAAIKYDVYVKGPERADFARTHTGRDTEFEAVGLRPYSTYAFRVYALGIMQDRSDEYVEVSCRTLEDVAEQPPRNLSAVVSRVEVPRHTSWANKGTAVTPTACVQVSWDEPLDVRGIVTGYLVTHRVLQTSGPDGRALQERQEPSCWASLTLPAAARTVEVRGQPCYGVIEIQVAAVTGAGPGKPASTGLTMGANVVREMKSKDPPRPAPVPVPQEPAQPWVRPLITQAEKLALADSRSAEIAVQEQLLEDNPSEDSLLFREGGDVRGVSNSVRRNIAKHKRLSNSHLATPAGPVQAELDSERLAAVHGTGKAVLYITSNGAIRSTYSACQTVLRIFYNLGYKVDIRDIYLSKRFASDLKDRLPDSSEVEVPQCWVKGSYIGGLREVVRLNEDGDLAKMLQGLDRLDPTSSCSRCGGAAYVPCWWCQGSKNSVIFDTFRMKLKCTICEESALVQCPDCTPDDGYKAKIPT